MVSLKIPLTQGKEAIIDEEDFELVNQYSWCLSGTGYAIRGIYYPETKKTSSIRMHRFILSAPKRMEVDHINGNRLDNRKENLRLCYNKENNRNKKKNRNNTSGFKGVTERKTVGGVRWLAQICNDNQAIFLGSFSSKLEAAEAHDKAAKELFGDFAKTNKMLNLF
jgi:hypothetical protein